MAPARQKDSQAWHVEFRRTRDEARRESEYARRVTSCARRCPSPERSPLRHQSKEVT